MKIVYSNNQPAAHSKGKIISMFSKVPVTLLAIDNFRMSQMKISTEQFTGLIA
jgi:hypothetical protein